MFSEKLPDPLTLPLTDSVDDKIDHLYSYFKDNLMNRNKRNRLFGHFIYLDCSKWIEDKNEMFWHIISLGEKEKFEDILPCNNCPSFNHCPGINCLEETITISLNNGQKRNVCLYRGIRINWINRIIELANQEDESISIWKEKLPRKRQTGHNQKLYLRFIHAGVDYTIVFEERYKRKRGKRNEIKDYFFITAFPTFYLRAKEKFRKAHKSYWEEVGNLTK
ncbi:hypothetical protein ACJA3J_05895 [Halobacillus sp. SY10]|uniref:hypothetical protein n=1 Tax=Halobacillus sp. SY10 TaxID=3381356 RepID=UPI0038797D7E